MYEILEVAVYVLSDYEFYATPRVVRELVCMTEKTAAVVTLHAVVPNMPILAIDTAVHTSFICNTGTAAVDAIILPFLVWTNLRATALLTIVLQPSMVTYL